jgi:hypothetical protein
MNFCNKSEKFYILLSSSINYCDNACISLHFLNEESLTVESDNLLSVSESSICLYINNEYQIIKIHDKCKQEIQNYRLFLKSMCI